ncbi:YaeQ family protein [Georgfuchsia toluolica]|uniref:YaeQ family protein n=1 Tax=Georgfuchsia toluolica TaxID=424218 RepID=A0A916N1G8_9PROT|nr:YaeQ family protein [Georgfuchsia toluolica]CAG4882650.1 YaeQ family protein [Georgfuchsia toluolica]
MALKSTVYKATLGIADMDRPYYGEHNLTLARHPSETEQRLMVRLLAFALYADERLEFGRGISSDDEPALWLKEYSGEIRLWIEVGLPDERLLRRAAGRAENVVVFAYGGKAMEMWWQKEGTALARLRNLHVFALSDEQSTALTALADRNMSLQCTVQDSQVWITNGPATVLIELRELTHAAG